METEKLLNILLSSISILDSVHTKTDDEFIEDRVTEVIVDLEYLVKELKK